jgi:hypothetical protein
MCTRGASKYGVANLILSAVELLLLYGREVEGDGIKLKLKILSLKFRRCDSRDFQNKPQAKARRRLIWVKVAEVENG